MNIINQSISLEISAPCTAQEIDTREMKGRREALLIDRRISSIMDTNTERTMQQFDNKKHRDAEGSR
jgi:hypothetical protein